MPDASNREHSAEHRARRTEQRRRHSAQYGQPTLYLLPARFRSLCVSSLQMLDPLLQRNRCDGFLLALFLESLEECLRHVIFLLLCHLTREGQPRGTVGEQLRLTVRTPDQQV